MTFEELTDHSFFQEIPSALLIDPDWNKKFKIAFQASCPEIYADIESLVLNGPTCSCNKKIKRYVEQNNKKIADLLWKFFTDNKISIIDYLHQIEVIHTPVSLSGKILKTTLKDWPDFAEEISRYVFRSFSVSKEGDTLFVYFL